MKKTGLALVVVFAVVVIFGCSVWAGELPEVQFKGTVIIFPTKDALPNVDLSQFEIGKGLENVPIEYKHLIGNVYRAQWITPQLKYRMGDVGYIFLSAYSDKEIEYLVIAGKDPYALVCPEDSNSDGFNCHVKEPKGSKVSRHFIKVYRISAKKGLVMDSPNGYTEIQEAGVLPKEVFQK